MRCKGVPHLGSQGDAGSHDDQHDEHIEEGEGDNSMDTTPEWIFTEKFPSKLCNELLEWVKQLLCLANFSLKIANFY